MAERYDEHNGNIQRSDPESICRDNKQKCIHYCSRILTNISTENKRRFCMLVSMEATISVYCLPFDQFFDNGDSTAASRFQSETEHDGAPIGERLGVQLYRTFRDGGEGGGIYSRR